MSNRAYLYSTNFVPGEDVDQRRIVGIAEWSHDVPLAFKLLLSANPRSCASLIWDDPEAVAVVGDYDNGVANLLRFLERVPHPAVAELAENARTFLDANKSRYFLLEPGEVFALGGDTEEKQLSDLLDELVDLTPLLDQAIADLEARMHEETHPPGFFARLFGAGTPVRRGDSNDMVFGLGLGGWSNSLFYEPK